jgi:hypothetical protein
MAYKYPNVISNTKNISYGDENDIDVHEDIQPFIDALAVKYPQWEFVSTGVRYTGDNNETAKSIRFAVFNDANPREQVGEIKGDYKYGDDGKKIPSYVVYNQRLARDRERGHQLETIKLPLAMKAVHKYFNPPPVTDLLEQVMTRGVGQFNHLVAHKERLARNTEYQLQVSKEQFIKANWDKYLDSLADTLLNVACKYKEEFDEYLRLFNVQRNNHALAVVIQNDKYVVSCNDKITTYDVNTIPIDLRAQLGLLKLMEENDVLEDVGVRTKDGFLVFLPKDKEHEVS